MIFDQGISPRVQRNLEKELECCVIERDEVILQIFADRAATKEASLQVELARLEYSLPRLTRMWTGLARQHGGVKGTRGGGEQQLERDRRQIKEKITFLKEQLKKVHTAIDTTAQREQPTPSELSSLYKPRKSSRSMHSPAGVLVENKLLRPWTRPPGSKNSGGSESFSLIPSDLSVSPHNLVDSFKSTLEEAKYADFLIRCDASTLI